jgi:hypothetical protein
MELFVGQVCDLDQTAGRTYTLRIIEYRYSLTPDGAREPLFRWEYVGQPLDPDARWCRHHLQGPITVGLRARRDQSASALTLNHLHLPTGWVPLEEVLRFCIVDLGVRPLTETWHADLEARYSRPATALFPPGAP